MTTEQCQACKYYQYEYIVPYSFIDEWCSKINRYFMSKGYCPYYEEGIE